MGLHPKGVLSRLRLWPSNGTNPTVTPSTSGLAASYQVVIAMVKALIELLLSLVLYSYVLTCSYLIWVSYFTFWYSYFVYTLPSSRTIIYEFT